MQVLQCRVQVLSQFPMPWCDKHHGVYPAMQWDQYSLQTLSGGMPCLLPRREMLCLPVGQLVPTSLLKDKVPSDGWWSHMPPALSLLPSFSLPAQRREQLQGLFRVFEMPRVKFDG